MGVLVVSKMCGYLYDEQHELPFVVVGAISLAFALFVLFLRIIGAFTA